MRYIHSAEQQETLKIKGETRAEVTKLRVKAWGCSVHHLAASKAQFLHLLALYAVRRRLPEYGCDLRESASNFRLSYRDVFGMNEYAVFCYPKVQHTGIGSIKDDIANGVPLGVWLIPKPIKKYNPQ